MLARFALALILMLGPVTSALALDRILTPEEELMITQINTHNSAIRTMAGNFLQIDNFGNRVEGSFFLERPNKIAFRYAPPSREAIVSQGTGFYVLDRREKTYYAYPQNQVPLRQFLKKDINLFTANITDVVTTTNYVSVTLSEETMIGVVDIALIFDVESKDLIQWTLTQPSGAELTFSLYDVIKNIDIPKALFRIDASYSPKPVR